MFVQQAVAYIAINMQRDITLGFATVELNFVTYRPICGAL